MSYRVEITRQALKHIKKLPKPLVQRLLLAARALGENPRPDGVRKLRGFDNYYRIREGDWRVIYTIEDEPLLVLVITIKPRGEAYKQFKEAGGVYAVES
jgi:mRNA interferase RelE/StbE